MITLIIRQNGQVTNTFVPESATTVIGRAPENDVVLDDPSALPEHARIIREGHAFFIRKTGMNAHIFINGQAIHQKSILHEGDMIAIGKTEICVEKRRDENTEICALKTRVLNPDNTVWEDEKTVIWNPAEKLPASYHKLVLKSGASLGKEHMLTQPETHIGRARSCPIRVTDKTVSEHHALIWVRGDQCLIKDLNSKNGTRLNGRLLRQSRTLGTGDEIRLGDTLFIFARKDEILSKEELMTAFRQQEKPSQTIFHRLLTLFCVALFFAGLATLTCATNRNDPPDATGTRSPLSRKRDAAEQPPDRVAHLLASAHQMSVKQLWQKAIEAYQAILISAPRNPEALSGLGKAEAELRNSKIFQTGMALIRQNEFRKGTELLQQIPSDSCYSARALAAIRLSAQKLPAKPSEPANETTPVTEKENRAADKKTGRSLIAGALKDYSQGEAERALRKLREVHKNAVNATAAERSRADRLMKNISAVRRLFEKGVSHYRRQRFDKAFKSWRQALVTDREIIQTEKGYYSDQIARHIADEYCQRASRFHRKGDLAKAEKHCAIALKALPGYPPALELRSLIREQTNESEAKSLLKEAEFLKAVNPEKARKNGGLS